MLIKPSMNRTRFDKLKKVLNNRQPDLTVLMDNVHKPHNLAAIARTCDAVGIYDIHASADTKKVKITQKTSGGVKKWTRIIQHTSIVDAASHLKKEGYKIVSAHLTQNSLDYREIDFTQKTAVVVGAELTGISREAEKISDHCIHIPMHGMVQSLNVSVACALILFEAERQRRQAGFYNSKRLDQKNYDKTLFEWAYPDIAAFCKKRDIKYPEIDMETGQLLERFSAAKYY